MLRIQGACKPRLQVTMICLLSCSDLNHYHCYYHYCYRKIIIIIIILVVVIVVTIMVIALYKEWTRVSAKFETTLKCFL